MAEFFADALNKVSIIATTASFVPFLAPVAGPIALGSTVLSGTINLVDRVQKGESIASTVVGVGADIVLTKVAGSHTILNTGYKAYKTVRSTATVTLKIKDIVDKGVGNSSAWEIVDVFNQVISTGKEWKSIGADVRSQASVKVNDNTVTVRLNGQNAQKTVQYTVRTSNKQKFQSYKNNPIPANMVVKANQNTVFIVTYDESVSDDIVTTEEY